MREPTVITPELIAQHGITPEEYQQIQAILGRDPNFTELGIFSVMWSEHCSYKSSRVYLAQLPTRGDCILQGPGENAGVVDIGDGLAIVFKMESHNHPSFIEPFQGAATGVGGIIRDIFTMGARPIALLDPLRFGPLTKGKSRYLLGGVVGGIAAYGNAVGVPTVGGELCVSETYAGNPLVNVFCLGIAPKDRIFLARASGEGNPVMFVGAKTGRDGIHGATMASETFDEGSEERRPTVQVGDPFKEKLLIEACLELMGTDALVGIQDMGAAGLTCSSCEMASRGGTGIEIDLARVPRRETGMIPYEVMLSESQERMLLVVRRGTERLVMDIFHKWDLDAVIVGRVTGDGLLRVKDGERVVAEIPAVALAEEGPVYHRPVRRPAYLTETEQAELSGLSLPEKLDQVLLDLLGSPNIASKQPVWQQYDHMLFCNTVVEPGSDAAVLRVQGTRKGLALAADGNGRYTYLDPYEGGKLAVAEAARNVVCAGARPLAITNCLNFGNPERPEIMWQFAEAVRGMGDACRALQTPVTGGNVSFYNETLGTAIFPTPIVGMVGLLDDIAHATTPWFKAEGDVVFLLGETREELGGSEYLKVVHGLEVGRPPALDLARERAVQQVCLEAIRAGGVSSAHDCADGGLAVALAECCMTTAKAWLGATLTLPGEMRPDALLFGESASRIVVSVRPDWGESVRAMARRHGVACVELGMVGGDHLMLRGQGLSLRLSVEAIHWAWSTGLSRVLI
ncbi:MAG: phosphoribosylformylglycinamidine synthase II [candidate division NC10 bacterium RIFCSPLOWO2_02_FULL_66_22]|nr:MAG: phosphoribosylformylglycinamidine synthase II [candidate division NC10 bacterium RIFCSPLOWO2_02_FULL_66_22]